MDYNELLNKALHARRAAYAPYSGFSVGAALLCGNGRVYTGCNIENAAYSPGVCAERVALFKAVSEGERNFAAIAVAGGVCGGEPHAPCPPCGVCRQTLAEFCGLTPFYVVLEAKEGYTVHTLAELLPHTFGLDR